MNLTKFKRPPGRCRRSAPRHRTVAPGRNEGGWQLIELLVGVLLTSALSSAIVSDWSQMLRFTTKGQNQVIAADLAQEVIDNARNSSWNELIANSNGGVPQTLLVNRHYSGEAGPAIFPRPLLQDWDNSSSGLGATYSQAARSGAFNGTVTETVTDNADGSVRVTVNVNWQEAGQLAGTTRNYSLSTLIAQNGIHN